MNRAIAGMIKIIVMLLKRHLPIATRIETHMITIVIAEIVLQANGVQDSPFLKNSTYTFFVQVENLYKNDKVYEYIE